MALYPDKAQKEKEAKYEAFLRDSRAPELLNNILIQLSATEPNFPRNPRRFLANAILAKIEDDAGFPKFTPKHTTTLAKVLTQEMWKKLNQKRTDNGWMFDMSIRPGVDHPQAEEFIPSGCVAGDFDCYEIFADLYNAVIEAEQGFKATDTHKREPMEPGSITGAQLDDSFVLQSSIIASRNYTNFNLAPAINRKERRLAEKLTLDASKSLLGELLGKYTGIPDMEPAKYKEQVNERVVFPQPVSVPQHCGGISRDWPDGRGNFVNDDANLLIWTNNENHVEFISTQPGGDMGATYERFKDAMTTFSETVASMGQSFQETEHYGFITSSPHNIGTAMKCRVTMKLPKLSASANFQDTLKGLKLMSHPTIGKQAEEGVIDICNSHTIGISENELIQGVCNGVAKLIGMEKGA